MGIEAISNTAGTYTANQTDKTVNVDKKSPNRAGLQNINISEKVAEIDGDEKKESLEKKESTPTQKQLKSALEQANQRVKNRKTACQFSYHEKTNRISITVRDKDTDEVIREIPAEEMLNMIEKMWELAGILVDEKL